MGLDAEGGQERGEPFGPGVVVVGGIGEEHVESVGRAGVGARGGVTPTAAIDSELVWAHRLHGIRMASGVPVQKAGIWGPGRG